MDDATIAGERSALRCRDDVACRRDTILQRHIPVLSTSLRAQRSNPEATSQDWIASSQVLLAMTAEELVP
jgi:hypothetical protein